MKGLQLLTLSLMIVTAYAQPPAKGRPKCSDYLTSPFTVLQMNGQSITSDSIRTALKHGLIVSEGYMRGHPREQGIRSFICTSLSPEYANSEKLGFLEAINWRTLQTTRYPNVIPTVDLQDGFITIYADTKPTIFAVRADPFEAKKIFDKNLTELEAHNPQVFAKYKSMAKDGDGSDSLTRIFVTGLTEESIREDRMNKLSYNYTFNQLGYDKDINWNELIEWATLSFKVRRHDPKVTAYLVIEIETVDGKSYLLSHLISRTRQMDWVSLRLRDFKFLSGPEEIKSPIEFIRNGSDLKSVSVVLNKSGAVPSGSVLQIENEILFDYALPNSLDLRKIFKDFTSIGKYNVPYIYGYRDEDSKIAAVQGFFDSMAKPQNQQWAQSIVDQGPDAIARELAKYGWKIGPTLNGEILLSSFMDFILRREVPVEGGSFGELHGEMVHHKALLAGFRDLNEHQSVFATYFILGIARNIVRWPLWNIFFDSRGKTMFGTPFWRDLNKHNK